MNITLELPQDLEKELAAEAAQRGLSLPDYVLRILSTFPAAGAKPGNGAELIEYWRREGLIGTRREIADSQAHARQLRDQAEHRFRE